jgi:hypothetical protein
VTPTGLTPETIYYFRVHSADMVDDNRPELYRVTKTTEMPPVPYLA